jgi:DNA polymerase-1
VPISFSLPEKSFLETVSAERITNLFRTLEFRSLLARIEKTFGGNGVVLSVEKEAESVPPEEIEKTAIALWVVNSDITDGGIKDILTFGKTDSFTEAKEKIEKALVDENLTLVYNEIEKPLYDVVKEMERTGVAVDKNVFISLIEKYKQRIVEIEKKVYELAGEEFNLASPKQLGEILFKKLGLVTKARNSKLSTKAEVLESLRDAHPIVPLMLEHREYAKLVSTYLEPIPTLVAPDGRLHARFIQHGSTTGRFSSANPNLQNLPIRTESGREIRKAFIAKKGSVLLSLDYSQIELRMVAILSGDPTLTDIFKTGKDVHTSVAVKVFGVKENEVTPEMRRRAKVINFGIIYGMGISALQKNLGSTRAEAQQFYDTYFAEFSEVRVSRENKKVC